MRQFVANPIYLPEREELRFLPEGPRVLQNYPGAAHLVGWVAIQHGVDRFEGSLNVLDLQTGINENFPLPGRPGFFAETTKPGTVIVGMDRRLVYFDLLSGALEETGVVVSVDESVIINDGISVPGGLLFGTKHLQFDRPVAALYHYSAQSREVRVLRDGQTCSNGKCFHNEGDEIRIIDIDSTPKTISQYQFDRRMEKLLHSRHVVAPASLHAFPEGLRASPDGNSVIVAFFNPAAVADGIAREIRISDGAVLTEWVLPGSPRVTCPEFAMIDGEVKVLFTTAVEGMPDEIRKIAPEAGALFVGDTHFTALPVPPPLFPY